MCGTSAGPLSKGGPLGLGDVRCLGERSAGDSRSGRPLVNADDSYRTETLFSPDNAC